ncbi:MAG: hypothetical protein GY854_32590 [Deltaproteobacteria bacterium]|nr:hypothetical protein [Deltaproteobacteria bacterium]
MKTHGRTSFADIPSWLTERQTSDALVRIGYAAVTLKPPGWWIMIRRLLAPLAILSATAAFACGQGAPLIIPEVNYIVDTRCLVLFATVRAVSNHAATRANPVDVDLQIDKVLRGNLPKNVKCKWTWPYDPFFIFPDGPPRTQKQQREAEAFAAEPVLPPDVGSKWVLLGDMIALDNGSVFAFTNKYPLSKEKLEWALAEIERSKRLKAEREQYAGQWPETPDYRSTRSEKTCGP